MKNGPHKTVVVTGASAGLGRSIVREFAKHGAQIGLLARGEDGLKGAKKDVEERGGKALSIPTDVSDYSQLKSAADKVEETFGPIDIWINNAMNSVFSPLKEIQPEEFKHVTEVTYLGQVYGTMIALEKMLPRDNGSIILVGSALAYRGIPLQSAYCGAKHAIHGFFESLSSELIHDISNVQLQMVQLPAMNTTQFSVVKNRLTNKPKPMGTIYEPEVAARVIYNTAIKDGERKVFVGYPTIQTILGNKFLPGFLDRYLAKKEYEGQQTEDPDDPGRKDNLWEPIPGDHGAQGDFYSEAWDFSPKLLTEKHQVLLWSALATLSFEITVLLNTLKKMNNRRSFLTIRSLKKIPWALLSIEAVLVVMSVLLALGLNSWQEGRADDQLAQRALQTMLDESVENCSKIVELQPYHRSVFWGEAAYEGLGQVFLRNDAWASAQTAGAIHHMDYGVAAAAGTVHALQSDHRRLVENGILAVYITATNQDVDLETFKEIVKGNKDWLRGPHPFMLADLIRIQEELVEAYGILFERSRSAYGDTIDLSGSCGE